MNPLVHVACDVAWESAEDHYTGKLAEEWWRRIRALMRARRAERERDDAIRRHNDLLVQAWERSQQLERVVMKYVRVGSDDHGTEADQLENALERLTRERGAALKALRRVMCRFPSDVVFSDGDDLNDAVDVLRRFDAEEGG
jgi:hypothetical protein